MTPNGGYAPELHDRFAMFPSEDETRAASNLSYGVLYALTVTACLLFMFGLIALAGEKHIDLRIVLFELATAWFAFLGLQAIHKKQNEDSPSLPTERPGP